MWLPTQTLATRCFDPHRKARSQGTSPVNSPTNPATAPLTPFKRERRIDVEPLVSAVALVALVFAVSAWRSNSEQQLFAPVEQAPTITASAAG
jgi:hypothetical protein